MNGDTSPTQVERIAIFSPHIDDAELACGGMMRKRLRVPRKTHITYMTSGRNSHLLTFGIKENPTRSEIKEARRREAIAAQQILGNCPEALHFFDYEDGLLFFYRKVAVKKTADLLATLRPMIVLVPYRYDRHPDHLATYDIVTTAIEMANLSIPIYQYFVWSLRHILLRPNYNLLTIDIGDELEAKKAAISSFKTQISCLNQQQPRPVLSSEFLQSFYSDKEYLLPVSEVQEPLFSTIISTAISTLAAYKYRYYLTRKFR